MLLNGRLSSVVPFAEALATGATSWRSASCGSYPGEVHLLVVEMVVSPFSHGGKTGLSLLYALAAGIEANTHGVK